MLKKNLFLLILIFCSVFIHAQSSCIVRGRFGRIMSFANYTFLGIDLGIEHRRLFLSFGLAERTSLDFSVSVSNPRITVKMKKYCGLANFQWSILKDKRGFQPFLGINYLNLFYTKYVKIDNSLSYELKMHHQVLLHSGLSFFLLKRFEIFASMGIMVAKGTFPNSTSSEVKNFEYWAAGRGGIGFWLPIKKRK